ncbi:MAG: tyrosine-type recombinase/integrase, partial [Acidobacteriota bacterium]
ATRAAGCPQVLFHDLRRSAARNLIRAGVSEKIAMEILGHRTTSIFRRYDITIEADKREALGRLAGIGTRAKQGQMAESGRVAQFRESSK